jgi:type I restriction enzyme, S subunit
MNVAKFEDLFLIPLRNGVSCPSARRGDGVPMVNLGEAFKFDRITDQECERVPLTDREFERCLLRESDLLFVRQSLKFEGAGRCIYVGTGKESRTWESHLIRVRLNPGICDSRYYYYFFRSPQGRIKMESIVEQVAAAGIRGSDLRLLKVPFPSHSDQTAIANVLWSLDDKIIINDRIAQAYEKFLRMRFEELNVDVETDPRYAIPASAIIEFNPSLSIQHSDDTVYLGMAAVPTDRAQVREWSRREPKSGQRFANGDTVMARITPCLENGKTAFIDFMKDGEVGIGSTEFIVMRAHPKLPVHFPYFLARSPRFQGNAIRNMVGSSGRQRVTAAQLADFPLARPDDAKLLEFGEDARIAFDHMKSLARESRILAELRDTLLPKLISGELRVRDAERAVEDVVL